MFHVGNSVVLDTTKDDWQEIKKYLVQYGLTPPYIIKYIEVFPKYSLLYFKNAKDPCIAWFSYRFIKYTQKSKMTIF